MKRLFDLLASGAGLVLLSPVMLWIAIQVRRSSPGRAVFVQERVGRHERVFRCYKFRTMFTAAPNAGSHEVAGSWVTPLGAKLRRYKLDELPQLWNVLRGDMSLVGPRPCLPSQHDVIAARRAADVFSARPGITGPAQLAGIDMSTPERLVGADKRYIETRSFLGDLAIILATATGKGAGDAVKG
ncbi:MAG: sugar transferase [Hyphomicrobiales bacterium]|jgi:O-antigen biosynthesis protein WbqP|nr:sugar transferase [Hyphomicrobiales bacterium]